MFNLGSGYSNRKLVPKNLLYETLKLIHMEMMLCGNDAIEQCWMLIAFLQQRPARNSDSFEDFLPVLSQGYLGFTELVNLSVTMLIIFLISHPLLRLLATL